MADFDCVIAITGTEGVGKSSLAYWVAKFTDKKFSLEKSFVFSPETQDAIKQVKELHQYGAIVMDEGIKLAYKLEWYKKVQRLLNKVYTINRNENKVTIICIPNFLDLSKYFRDHRILFWIHVYARGKAAVFMKLDNPFSNDIWQMDKNNKQFLKGGKKLLFSSDESVDRIKASTNFFANIEFPPLPDDIYKDYKILKDKYKYDDMDDDISSNKFQQRDLLLTAMKLIVPSKIIGQGIDMSTRRLNEIAKSRREATGDNPLILYINNNMEVILPKKP